MLCSKIASKEILYTVKICKLGSKHLNDGYTIGLKYDILAKADIVINPKVDRTIAIGFLIYFI